MEKIQYLGICFILASILLIWNPFSIRFEVVDTTPPEWVIENGLLMIGPRDGETYYKINGIMACVKDLESGVVNVTAVLDGKTYNLELGAGDKYQGTWYVVFSQPLQTGRYSMLITAINGVGLKTTYKANFEVYFGIQGDWYINGQQVSSFKPLFFSNNTLTFKFVKTIGPEDYMIRCTVNYTGSETGSLVLHNFVKNTWEGSYNFTSGLYTITLTVSDGIHTINTVVYYVEIKQGYYIVFPSLTQTQQIGLILLFVGLVLCIVPYIRKPQIKYEN